MDTSAAFPFETQAMSLLAMYRMAGLRNALLYLHDIVLAVLPVARINAILCSTDGDMVISVADTSMINVSNKYRSEKRPSPLVAPGEVKRCLIIDDLEPHKRRTLQTRPGSRDMPHLCYRSLLRIPLFRTHDSVFLVNFWSDRKGGFRSADQEPLQALLKPLAEELKIHLSSLALHQAPKPAGRRLSGKDKIGLRPGLGAVRALIEQVADTDCTVLILGETGTGKEAVADMLHERSPRHAGPFIKVNCGAIPESLLDSELFGHEKGAFTGALASRPGYFEMAEGGTIFLDEIGEMPLATQVRLLRVLDGGIVRRVGGGSFFPVDVRVIAASHDDLPLKVRDGRFRMDLWYRLSVFPLKIPALRFCMEDIAPLVAAFIQEKSHKLHIHPVPKVGENELYKLYSYDFPGNVRELEHMVERALILHRGRKTDDCLTFAFDSLLPDASGRQPLRQDAGPEWASLREHEDSYILRVLEHCGGKLTGKGSATDILKIHYATLRTRMRKMGLPEHSGADG